MIPMENNDFWVGKKSAWCIVMSKNSGDKNVVVVRNQASVNKINNYLITFNVS